MNDNEIVEIMKEQIQQIKDHTPELTSEELEEIVISSVTESEFIPEDEKEEIIETLLEISKDV